MKRWYVNLGIYTNGPMLDVWVIIYAQDSNDAQAAAVLLYPGHVFWNVQDTPPDA